MASKGAVADQDFQNIPQAMVSSITGPKLKSCNYISLLAAQGVRALIHMDSKCLNRSSHWVES